jgi:hypothetical protein
MTPFLLGPIMIGAGSPPRLTGRPNHRCPRPSAAGMCCSRVEHHRQWAPFERPHEYEDDEGLPS